MKDSRLTADRIWELVGLRAAATPEAVLAYDEHGRQLTFGGLEADAKRVAAGLARRGVRRGTVVSWQLPSRLETIVVIAALARLGAVQNPLIMMLREPDVRFICAQAGSELLLVPPDFRGFPHAEMAAAVARDVPGLDVLVIDGALPEGDPAQLEPESASPRVRWLFYTSGTTASPKGARHTDPGLIAASTTFCAAIRPGPQDRVAALAPMAHVGGVLHVVTALQTGCALLVSDVFSPASTQLLSERQVTFGGNGVPFARTLIEQQRARPDRPLFPGLKAFLVGGAPRTAALHEEIRSVLGGVGVVSGYGLTECPYFAWAAPGDGDHELATTEGRPGPGAQARIVRSDGTEAAPGESGELRVKAPQLMLGYVDADLDSDTFDGDGYFRTGDLAMLDEKGYLTITGRLKDVIIRNMENISAREVEEALLACPGVADAAVIGLPDTVTGERVCAVVVPANPADPPVFEELCARLLAGGLNKRKLPVQLELVEDLPRNALLKVVKRELRERFAPRGQSTSPGRA
ncbi:AMP-binding protein [Streptomyces sp. NPDC096311]|uniref:AMP-binding protein n=1 Tax=Streptomyces sp. NPDC096311 TaxID=3366083 RepID=UPI00382A0B3D